MIGSSTSWVPLPSYQEIAAIEQNAISFVMDETPHTLNVHNLRPEDVDTLMETNRGLAVSVIARAHAIFSKYRTNEYRIVDKLDPSKPAWKMFCDIIRLGANILAADNHIFSAQELLVYASLKKIIPPLDPIQGNYYLNYAAMRGRNYSQYLLGTLMENPHFTPEQRAEDKMYLKSAAINAQFPLALYRYGKHLLQSDPEQGVSMITSAASRGLAEAQRELGLMYFHGTYVERDYTEATELLSQAKLQGYTPVYNDLGFFFLFGLNGNQDLYRAVQLFKLAAAADSQAAHYNLAYCYMMGWGVLESNKTGIEHHQIAQTLRHDPSALLISEFNTTTTEGSPTISDA